MSKRGVLVCILSMLIIMSVSVQAGVYQQYPSNFITKYTVGQTYTFPLEIMDARANSVVMATSGGELVTYRKFDNAERLAYVNLERESRLCRTIVLKRGVGDYIKESESFRRDCSEETQREYHRNLYRSEKQQNEMIADNLGLNYY